MYYNDGMYLLVIVLSMVLGFATQAMINRQYKKYSQMAISTGLSGAQTARMMLDAHGLANIPVRVIAGNLTDNYDPKTNVVSLSEEVFNGRSVSSTAIACHECGHAIQHATEYAPVVIRKTLFPVVNVASKAWYLLVIIGMAIGLFGLMQLGVLLFGFVLLFQLVTLPVEFNASARARAYIGIGGYLPEAEQRGARKVLNAAAMTYVAGALISFMQFMRYAGMVRRRR